jgi:hypothetical protein
MKKVLADIDYLIGHLRYGHYELTLNDAQFKEFENYTDSEKKEYIRDNGELVLDDYSVDNIGDIVSINIEDA